MERTFIWGILILIVAAGAYFLIQVGYDDEKSPVAPTPVADPELPTVSAPEKPSERDPSRILTENSSAQAGTPPVQQGDETRVQGKVTDLQGEPIPGARVTMFTYVYINPPLIGRVRPDHREEVRATATTGSDGRYVFNDLGDVPAPIFSLRIEAEGYSELLKDAVGPGMIIDASLEPGGVIDIRVIDAETKQPIAGVSADLSMKSPGRTMHEYRRWRRKTKSDQEGLVHVIGAPTEKLTIFLEHPDYQWLFIKPEDEIWVTTDSRKALTFELQRGVTLNGLVVDARTKEPVRDCLVTLRELIIPTRREKTGVFGKFKFAGLNRGRFEVNFEADGYTRRQEMLEISDDAMKEQRVFEMIPAGMASGTVVNERGDPVVGAELYVAEAKTIFRSVRGEAEDVSDRQGTFSIRNLNDGQTYRVVARMPGYALGFSNDFVATSGQFFDGVIVQLQEGASIQGLVSDPVGVPIEGAVVTIEQPPFSGAWFPPGHPVGQKQTLSITTDEKGYWKLAGLWSGPYQVTVDHPDYIAILPEQVRIDVGNERIEKNFNLIPGHVIEGMVTLPAGEPAVGVQVTGSIGAFQNRVTSARTDSEGRYRLTRLLERPYRVKAMGRSGVALEQKDVPVDSRNVDFRLEPYGGIEGVVMSFEGGAPIDSFTVRLLPLMALGEIEPGRQVDERLNAKLMTSHEAFLEKTVVNPDGRFSLGNIHPGEYIVEVEARDRVGMKQSGIVVNPAGIVPTQPFILRAGAAFQGTALDSDGRPISGNALSLRMVAAPNSTLETTLGPDGKPVLQKGRSPWPPRDVPVDDGGRFYSGGLPAGILRVQLNSPIYCCPPWEDITFGKDGVIEREYRLKKGGKVVLQVVDQFAKPVDLPGAQVYDQNGEQARVDDRVVAARGDIKGKVEIAKLAPGRYTIRLQRFEFAEASLEIEVREGEEIFQEVTMEKLVR